MRRAKRLAAVVAALALVATVLAGSASAHDQRQRDGRQVPHLRDLQHIVVLMQENRSYDEYFGALTRTAKRPSGNPNPAAPSSNIAPFHQSAACEVDDLNHAWTGTHAEINGGRMDGFTAQNAIAADPTGSRAMGYYDARDLPLLYRLANTFGVGDRYF